LSTMGGLQISQQHSFSTFLFERSFGPFGIVYRPLPFRFFSSGMSGLF
jgi:hypothetical protein